MLYMCFCNTTFAASSAPDLGYRNVFRNFRKNLNGTDTDSNLSLRRAFFGRVDGTTGLNRTIVKMLRPALLSHLNKLCCCHKQNHQLDCPAALETYGTLVGSLNAGELTQTNGSNQGKS